MERKRDDERIDDKHYIQQDLYAGDLTNVRSGDKDKNDREKEYRNIKHITSTKKTSKKWRDWPCKNCVKMPRNYLPAKPVHFTQEKLWQRINKVKRCVEKKYLPCGVASNKLCFLRNKNQKEEKKRKTQDFPKQKHNCAKPRLKRNLCCNAGKLKPNNKIPFHAIFQQQCITEVPYAI